MESAFSSTKLALANATMLVHPTVDSETALTVDASDQAIGGVLEQRIDGMWKPLALFSKQLRAPEQKYSAFARPPSRYQTFPLLLRRSGFHGLYRPQAFNFRVQQIIRSLVRETTAPPGSDLGVYDGRKTRSRKEQRSGRCSFPVPNSSHPHTMYRYQLFRNGFSAACRS